MMMKQLVLLVVAVAFVGFVVCLLPAANAETAVEQAEGPSLRPAASGSEGTAAAVPDEEDGTAGGNGTGNKKKNKVKKNKKKQGRKQRKKMRRHKKPKQSNTIQDLNERLQERYGTEILNAIKKFRAGRVASQGSRAAAITGRKFNPSKEQISWLDSLSGHMQGRSAFGSWKPRERKEFRQLSRTERERFLSALWAMKTTMVGSLNQYDLFLLFHQEDWSPAAHFGAAFLPWHREFLYRFERALQMHDPSVTLPYWDSTKDYNLADARSSVMWDYDMMGNINGQVYIAHRLWPVHPMCQINGSRYLLRGGPNTLGSTALFKNADIKDVYDKTSFRDVVIPPMFEWEHGGVHVFVSGHMFNLTCSPADPLFYLHHAFVDLVWETFRNQSQETNAFLEYPSEGDIGGPGHMPYSRMAPFDPLQNVMGLEAFYTKYFYSYSKPPESCETRSHCTSDFFFCHDKQCTSKVKWRSNCTGFEDEEDSWGPCRFGRCIGGICR